MDVWRFGEQRSRRSALPSIVRGEPRPFPPKYNLVAIWTRVNGQIAQLVDPQPWLVHGNRRALSQSLTLEERTTVRRGRRPWDRGAGLAVAALVHLGLFATFFAPQAPAKTGGTQDDGQPGVSVTLVRLSAQTARIPAASSETERLENLRIALSGGALAAAPAQPYKPPTDPEALIQNLDKLNEIAASRVAEPRAALAGSAESAPPQDDPYARASVPSSAPKPASGSDLWPQIARCWKPAKAFPKVTVTVAFDERGGLSEPPSVVRDPALTVDQNRLQAEGEAVRAVIACAPYSAAGGGPRRLQLEFAPKTGVAG